MARRAPCSKKDADQSSRAPSDQEGAETSNAVSDEVNFSQIWWSA